MKIKLQTPEGFFCIELNDDSTFQDLKDKIMKTICVDKKYFKLLTGYPPKNMLEEDSALLRNCYINSGDIVIVQIIESRKEETAANFISSQPGTSGNKRKRTSTEKICLICDEEIMVRVEVPSDNSCLFTCIHYIHFGFHDKLESFNLRKIIAKTISENPKEYNSIYLGRENADYCQWIMHPNSWGGAIELSIFSDHFKIEIICIDIMSGACLRFGQGKYDFGGILLYDGIHYDPLVMECDHVCRTEYCTNNEHYLNLANQIARDARQKRQFTDLKNFKIMCRVCGVHLTGEEEVALHAKATNHDNFGEIV